MFPAIEKFVTRDAWYLPKMERHLFDPTWYKIFFSKNWNVCSIRAREWPLSSPDVNPLDYFYYFYWDFVKTNVYEGSLEIYNILPEIYQI